jgi:hypothetical protein
MAPKYCTHRTKAFAGGIAKVHRFRVEGDGSVRVWDDVGQLYTRCHSMTKGQEARIRRKATAI